MNQPWPAEQRVQLEQQKAVLTERVDKIKADVMRGLDADSKEQATQLENRQVLEALANDATEELKKVKAALQRLEDGSYGICIRCSNEIDKRRLQARPHASRCMACAS